MSDVSLIKNEEYLGSSRTPVRKNGEVLRLGRDLSLVPSSCLRFYTKSESFFRELGLSTRDGTFRSFGRSVPESQERREVRPETYNFVSN